MNQHSSELLRYITNGLVATAVHYTVFVFNLEVLSLSSAAIANLAAALVGIAVSFLGSRYFVFRKIQEPVVRQFFKFGVLYGSIAILHGLVLLIWTDWFKYDYRIGFLIATGFQVSMSYCGNKFLVFKA